MNFVAVVSLSLLVMWLEHLMEIQKCDRIWEN